MPRIQVIVELAVAPPEGLGALPRLPALPCEVDPSFGHVPLCGASKGHGATPHGAPVEHNTLVRAHVDDDQLGHLRAVDEVLGVWSDPKIEPIGPGPVSFDCAPHLARGDAADVARALGVARLWETGVDGHGMVIGVVDGGIDRDRYPVDDGWTPDPGSPPGFASGWNKHGNMCAFDCLIAAPKARLYDLGIGKTTASATALLSSALQAFQWALERFRLDGTPQILSNSWGLYQQAWDPFPPGEPGNFTHDPQHPVTRKAIELIDEGMLLVFAAGNCGDQCGGTSGRCGRDVGPGRSIRGLNGHPRMICVGAVNPLGQPIGYGSQGPSTMAAEKPDLCGYAHFVGDTPSDSGTSAACPVVAGVLALLRAAHPCLRQDRAREALIATARPVHGPGHHPASGFGVVDAARASQELP